MSKVYLCVLYIAICTFSVKAQTATNKIDSTGNVGIGTLSPSSLLHVNLGADGKALQLLGINRDVEFHLGHDGSTHGYFWRYKGTQSGNNNNLQLWAQNQGAGPGVYKPVYKVFQDGNIFFKQKVGIGTEIIGSEQFAVAGTAKAQEVIVEENAGADFVFEEDYDLPTLANIEKFIKANKHLEGIPSAEEMKANGVKVGELQIKLLQKIEELTLHTIEQQKLINELLKRIEKLENEEK